MFPRISYLEWMEGRPAVATHDLGSSDLRGDRDFEPAAVPAPLADLPEPPAGVSLETLLATEYGVHPEQVVVTAGASHANFLAVATALGLATGEADGGGGGDDADEAADDDSVAPAAPVAPTADESAGDRPRVLVEKPGYEPLRRTPAGLGATVDRFQRTAPGYELDPERVEAALRDGTRLVAVTNRHNPGGRLADGDRLAAVASVVADADARLLVDEVYAPYVPPGETTDGPFGAPSAAGLDGTVVTGSLTKFFGLDDLRVGWLVADREFAAAARRVAPHLPVVAGPSRALGLRALHAADELAADRRELLVENADELAAFADARDDLSGTVQPGCSFAFLDPDGVGGDELAEAAADAGVLVVPGRFFDDADRVRVSLGREPSAMRSALENLAAVLDSLR